MTIRVAMWSGPRSLSTAMMRAWENRADTAVVDEPLYACYLAETGIDHPMRDEVIASQSTDWREVTAELIAAAPRGAAIYYQKHMAHHLLPSMGRAWLDELSIAFLVRDPRAILGSYEKKRARVTLADIGVTQLSELFDRVADRRGAPPPVVVAEDLQADPRGVLTRLCAALAVPFSERMLSWPAGRRATDGVWARHWYEDVERSTGFSPPRYREVTLSEELESLARAAAPHHEKLLTARL
jgi:hypothetical protein